MPSTRTLLALPALVLLAGGLAWMLARAPQGGEAALPSSAAHRAPTVVERPSLAEPTTELAVRAAPVGSTTRAPVTAGSEDAAGAERGPYEVAEGGRTLLWLPPHTDFDVLVGEDLVASVRSGAAGELGAWRMPR